jgi:hypothetical protein
MAALLDLLDRPIAYHRVLVAFGGRDAAIMLSQALYWTKRTKDAGGWFHKTVADWEEETGLSKDNQLTAKKQLMKYGVIETKRGKLHGLNHYRVNVPALQKALLELTVNGKSHGGNASMTDGGNAAMNTAGMPPSGGGNAAITHTETTQRLQHCDEPSAVAGGGIVELVAPPTPETPMDLPQFVETCRANPRRHVRLIGEWADEVRPNLTTYGQWREYIRRNVRTANRLTAFTDDQMAVAMAKIDEIRKRSDFDPTMETLLKQLTK